MLELADTQPAFTVTDAEYQRLLGYPQDHDITSRSRELADAARAWYAEHGRPWLYARQAGQVALGDGRVTINGARFTSDKLHDQWRDAQANDAMLVAVSAGAECEAEARRLWDEGKPDEYFFHEVYGSAVVEALVAAAAFRLCEWSDTHGVAVLPHYSPGYPDWDIADQQLLFDLMRRGAQPLPGGLSVFESGMLQPKKSLLAVFGLTPNVAAVERLTSLVPCTNCALPGCRYRRRPYRHPLPQLEGVSAAEHETAAAAAAPPPLKPAARYSIATRVLEKWSRERLELRVLGDRTVDARFRYEGTTCSNMGHALEFEYHVRLAARDAGYTITTARCAPAPRDTGHTSMCEYLVDAESLMSHIANDAPLVGRPLDEVIGWQRSASPSGCFCTAASREHKWGLVYEVLHYTLAQSQQESP